MRKYSKSSSVNVASPILNFTSPPVLNISPTLQVPSLTSSSFLSPIETNLYSNNNNSSPIDVAIPSSVSSSISSSASSVSSSVSSLSSFTTISSLKDMMTKDKDLGGKYGKLFWVNLILLIYLTSK